MVFRPLYLGEQFSKGVVSEIEHWMNIVKVDPYANRRIVFVHFYEDIESYIRKQLKEKLGNYLEYEIVSYMRPILKEYTKSPYIHQYAREILKEGRIIHPVSGTLGRDLSSNMIRRINENAQRITMTATINYLKENILMVGSLKELEDYHKLVGLWIVKNFEDFKSEVGNISKFFRNGSPASNNWEREYAHKICSLILKHKDN